MNCFWFGDKFWFPCEAMLLTREFWVEGWIFMDDGRVIRVGELVTRFEGGVMIVLES